VEKATEVANHRKCVDGDNATVDQRVRQQLVQAGGAAGGPFVEAMCRMVAQLLHQYVKAVSRGHVYACVCLFVFVRDKLAMHGVLLRG
jgi:hypothetical protein